MKIIKDKKGFTLIELIVVLGLAGIVISVVMSFFIANYRSYEAINTESELQYQSQYIINFITNKILEAEKYKGEEDNADGTVKEAFFYDNSKELTFQVISEQLVINDGDGEVSIGDSIKSFDILPNPASLTPEEAKEVLITLKLEKSGQKVEAEQTVYMRNYAASPD